MISANEKIRNAILTVLIIIGAKVVQWTIECVQVLAEIVKILNIITPQNEIRSNNIDNRCLFSSSK